MKKQAARAQTHKDVVALVAAVRGTAQGKAKAPPQGRGDKGPVPHLQVLRIAARAMRHDEVGTGPHSLPPPLAATDTLIEHVAERSADIIQETGRGNAPDCTPAAVTFHTFHNGSRNMNKSIRFCLRDAEYGECRQ
jgi:hypothetical protein